MSYTVFALKWRPQSFDQIIGQPHIVATLKNAIKTSRLAHAYLFSGPRGVGKTSTARIFARALNCKDGPTVEPCQKCSSCLEIAGARSFDVIEIDGASNRGIDEIRVLRENVKFAPASGKFKIYIIDEVHMLTTEAFNALLKTLEEPPEFVKFIFATTQASRVLPTILSRCQRFDFRRIPALEIGVQLERIASAEKMKVDKDALFAIAKSSDGSLRDAESVLDQLYSFSKDRISLKEVISVLGIVEQEALFEITDKIIQKDPKGALGLFNRFIDEGKDAGVFLKNLIEHFRNLMVAKVAKGDSKLVDLPQESCARLIEQGESFSLEEMFIAFNILVKTQEMCKRLDSLRIPLEISLVRLACAGKEVSAAAGRVSVKPSAVPTRPLQKKEPPKIEHPEAKEETLPQEDEQAAEEGPPLSTSIQAISLEAVRSIWDSIIKSLERVKMSVASYLTEGDPVGIEGDVLTVSFPKSHLLHKESLEDKTNKEIVEHRISEALNKRLRLNFVLSDKPEQRNFQEEGIFVQAAMDTFKARIIKEEI